MHLSKTDPQSFQVVLSELQSTINFDYAYIHLHS